MTSRYLKLLDAAIYLGQTERFMRRLVSERRIRYYKIGKFVHFDAKDLDAFAAAGRVDPVAGLIGVIVRG